ncbi:MAG: flagellar assembly protein FliW [Eubacterium sp.]|jgi:Uncharacterized protein conserved in bacteria|nr:flagellar assembly protein FliW [Eubacterium sp.]
MKSDTRLFGEIDIEEEKLICFENGIIGFPDMKKFSLIYDSEGKRKQISWLQSMEDPEFALPVINPLAVKPDYEPMFSEESLAALGDIHENNAIVLTTITVPKELEKMSVNLKAPIVINGETRQAAQIIIEDDFPVKYFIYDLLKKKAGE